MFAFPCLKRLCLVRLNSNRTGKKVQLMGIYLNPGKEMFQESILSKIYVDKTGLIAEMNDILGTEEKFVCVSRPRRFGKSMAAKMLVAYYSRECDSRELFSELNISKNPSFEKYLNQFDVLFFNMQRFLSRAGDAKEMLPYLQMAVLKELRLTYGEDIDETETKLVTALEHIYNRTKKGFVFIIDEWDCVLRDDKIGFDEQKTYLNFLCDLFKGQSYVALAYMTGILPIKKYGKHSAINVFYEFSMIDAEPISEFTGFTEVEVKELCQKYNKSFVEMKNQGVKFKRVESIHRSQFNNYWSSTETYEALQDYIKMNFDGLKDKVTKLIAGEKIVINSGKFQNDMTTLKSSDDIFTLLVHLGYLTFDFNTSEVWIPNSEVAQEFINSIEDGGWEEVMNAIKSSDKLLKATLNCEEEKVAELIDKAHSENTSILKYNDENSLSCVISLAYYCARKTYTMERELPAGKGYADIVFKPRRNNSNPAIIVELKYDKTAEGAIEQIKEKQYADCLNDYTGEILLIGINYDKEDKKHTCRIDKITK